MLYLFNLTMMGLIGLSDIQYSVRVISYFNRMTLSSRNVVSRCHVKSQTLHEQLVGLIQMMDYLILIESQT